MADIEDDTEDLEDNIDDLEDYLDNIEDYLDDLDDYLDNIKYYWDNYDYFVENHIYTCLICGKPVTRGFYICNECAKILHLVNKNGKQKKPSEWPVWLRFLYNNERKWRGIGRKPHTEVPFDEEFNEPDYV